ncbi:hypothetical protein IWW36_002492 [Coemansia brasiliensis]|uniref:DASH complex subunit DUO1 n=1 Tax=Coemansia brasiliensis TaxID=2650707 RepID=A0A9W8LZE5_9FUNG|nr:hypothetical protein IWW36_002492 [Coemansia brasiliensis]
MNANETSDILAADAEQPIEDVELEELRRVRRALSKMNQGIENMQYQMKYFNSNVSQTTQLLDIWVRVLSQTVHNQGFLLNEEWHGSSLDTAKLNDLIQRDIRRQEEAERLAHEAELRREQELAEAREQEKKRAEQALAAENAARQQPARSRSGVMPGRRPPLGPAARGSRRGAGTRRGTSSIPPSTNSRIRAPR